MISWKWLSLGAGAGISYLLTRTKVAQQVLTYISTDVRDSLFGPIQFMAAPTAGNPEAILITNNFENAQIITRVYPLLGKIRIHRQAAPSLDKIMAEIVKKGWSKKIKQFNGCYVPRFVRDSQSSLSSHSYGTSIDINASENPRFGQPTADQKLLAPIFEKHGWYWGNRFKSADPMHFEYILKSGSV